MDDKRSHILLVLNALLTEVFYPLVIEISISVYSATPSSPTILLDLFTLSAINVEAHTKSNI